MDYALGAFLGACIGDAAGATLEFKRTVKSAELKNALSMKGGGVWETAPGQITDDGELTLCLAHSLAEMDQQFDIEKIAAWYDKWIQSSPFDIGNTTRSGLGAHRKYKSLARSMSESAMVNCMEAKSNGSMMRAVPLAIWGCRLSDEDLVHIVNSDCSLSHPNPSVVSAVTAYVIAIAHLINHPGDRNGAWERVVFFSQGKGCNQEVKEWIKQIEAGIPEPAQPSIGFVKIAFVQAFLQLRKNATYLDAITETLSMGGDTDTNTCIVGGLIGAATGARNIPEAMRNAVLNCNIKQGGQSYRPDWLSTRQIPVLVEKLLKNAPVGL